MGLMAVPIIHHEFGTKHTLGSVPSHDPDGERARGMSQVYTDVWMPASTQVSAAIFRGKLYTCVLCRSKKSWLCHSNIGTSIQQIPFHDAGT